MLMPLLAKLADAYGGKFFLAKINTDVEQHLASQYNVRSLPTVKLFKNGAVVDEFMGVQPERVVRDLLDRHLPRPSDALIDRAIAAIGTGDHASAAKQLASVIAAEPSNDRAKLELATLYLAQRQFEQATTLVESLSSEANALPRTAALRGQLDFARALVGAPPESELEILLMGDPANSAARYQLGAAAALSGRHEHALEHFLAVVRQDRKFGDDAARKAMLTVFAVLDNHGDIVKKYRALLSSALN